MAESAGGLVRVRRIATSPRIDDFRYAAETYPAWSLISAHSGAFEFSLGSGSGVGMSGVCQPGEMVICPPRMQFRRAMCEPTGFLFTEFELPPERGDETGWWPVGLARATDRRRLRENLDRIDRWRGLSTLTTREVHHHLVADILLLAIPGRGAAPQDGLVGRATEELDRCAYDPDLSLTELAARLGISGSQLTRRFRAVHQVTPVRYVTQLRIDRARRLLVGTDRTVASVAATCGYASAYYFARAFRRETGQTPSEYRRSGRV